MKAIAAAVAATLAPMATEGAEFPDPDPVLLLDGAVVVLADASALPEVAVEVEEPSEPVEEEVVVAGASVVAAGSSVALEASSEVVGASVASPPEKLDVVSVLPLESVLVVVAPPHVFHNCSADWYQFIPVVVTSQSERELIMP